LAAASLDGDIYLWDVVGSVSSTSSQLLLILSDPARHIHDLIFSPDGARLATAGADGSIRVWDIQPEGGTELPAIGKSFNSLGHQQTSIALSPDGRNMAIAQLGQTPAVWNTETGELAFNLLEVTGIIEDISYSSDGTVIATCSHAGPLILWNAVNGHRLASLKGFNEGGCNLAFHPEENILALGFNKNDASWYQTIDLPGMVAGAMESGDLSLSFPWRGNLRTQLVNLAFSRNGEQLAGVTDHGELFVWDPWLEDSLFVNGMDVIDVSILLEDQQNYQDGVFHPNRNLLATIGNDGILTIWDTQTMEAVQVIPAHNGKVITVVISPDGKEVATASTDSTIKIWDIDTGQNLLTLFSQSDEVTDLAFSPDGKKLYAADSDGTVQVYMLDEDDLMALVRDRLTRSLTAEECQIYLNMETCP
jgi:WD40 repeat protein